MTKRNGAALGTPDVTAYAYDAVGNLDTVALANGLATEYSYDVLNRLTLETVRRGQTMVAEYDYNASGMELASDGQREGVVEKRYDGAGDLFSTTTIDWTYDGWNRLTGEDYIYDEEGGSGNDYAFSAAYVYDPVGNRLSKTAGWSDNDKDESVAYYYGVRNGDASRGALDGNDWLLVEYGTVGSSSYRIDYAYDANGALIEKERTISNAEHVKYQWDLRGRMVGLDANADDSLDDNGDIVYTYDANGTRVSKTLVNVSATHFLVDDNNPMGYSQVLQESSTLGGSPTMTYDLGADVIAQTDNSGTIRYLVYDGHGSTRFLADSSGNAVSGTDYAYDAFGNALFTGTAATSLLYSGEAFDAGLKQYYLRARYYDQAIGRFSSFDPAAMTICRSGKAAPVQLRRCQPSKSKGSIGARLVANKRHGDGRDHRVRYRLQLWRLPGRTRSGHDSKLESA